MRGDGDRSNDQLAAGIDVGGYVIDGVLGAGAMGVVYAATHPLIGKRAAIKVLKPDRSNHPAAVERFMLEARAVNQIGHPNIVDIFAFGQLPDGRSYYVMDLLTGETLRRRIKRGGPLHVSEAASVIDEVASALIAAHAKGIIHRDLKPDNVFMVSVGGRWPEVRVLDWGLLKLTPEAAYGDGGSHGASNNMLSGRFKTVAGSLMGTPAYMSPEQARASESVDARTDIYSFGAMAYEMVSGDVPFKTTNPIEALLAHQDQAVPPLAAKCPTLPEELVQLIEAMLAKDPAERPTLPAVRAVIKRLRASAIPMTAAGFSLPPITPSPIRGGDPRGDDEEQENNETIEHRPDEPSIAMTMERRPTPVPPPSSPGLLVPQSTLAGHLPSPGAMRSSTPAMGRPIPGSPVPGTQGSYRSSLSPSHSSSPSMPPSLPLIPYTPPSYASPSAYSSHSSSPPAHGSHPSSPPTYASAPVQPSDRTSRNALIVIAAVIALIVGISLLLAQ